jgi:ferritin-like metal-binding protein YciE
MAEDGLEEQLVKYLADAHSIEEQALPQLRAAPQIAGDESLAEAFREHERETEEQQRLVRERLEAHDGSPTKLKDTIMKLGGAGFVLFAKSQPDTPGKLTAHAYSFEHLELASYELLLRVAERAGDAETAEVARRIRDQEAAMARRLESHFDAAVAASLAEKDQDELEAEVVKYLTDQHAIEGQSIQLLELGPRLASDAATAKVYRDHLEESRAQQTILESRLEAHGESPSRLKDLALRAGAFNWAAFFQAQPDTPGKLAAFVYAVEHLEISGLELLKRVAARAGDEGTVEAVDRVITQERSAARVVAGEFDRAVEASLAAQGVTAPG